MVIEIRDQRSGLCSMTALGNGSQDLFGSTPRQPRVAIAPTIEPAVRRMQLPAGSRRTLRPLALCRAQAFSQPSVAFGSVFVFGCNLGVDRERMGHD